MIVLSTFGLLSLLGAVVAFCVMLPRAYVDDGACAHHDSLMPLSLSKGPCDSFFGTYLHTFGVGPLQVDVLQQWIPLGWALAVTAIPFALLSMCLACLDSHSERSRHRLRGYYLQDVEGNYV